MSYILDALKKSEEERKKGDVPGLQTYTPSTEVSSGKKTWVIGVMVLIGTNVIGLFLWSPWQSTPPSSITAQEPRPEAHAAVNPAIARPIATPKVEPVAKLVIPKPVVAPMAAPIVRPVVRPFDKPLTDPVIETPGEQSAPAIKIQPAPREAYSPKKAPSTAYLPQLSELPQSIQSQIPDLTFSSHMYSSQDRFRSITINGKRLKQGRYYNDLLYVNEITEKGAIMGFEGTLFEVDVLGQWGN